MSLATVTYNSFINTVKDLIKANCINISDYSSLPSCFKSGYSVSYEATCADKSTCITYSAGATFKIANSSVISEVAASQVDTNMSSFLNTYCSAVNLDNPISQENYLAFMQDMICFAFAHCKFATSYFTYNTNYLVYISSVMYNNPHVLVSDKGYKFVQAIDINYESKGLLDNIFNNCSDTNRLYNVYYSVNTY